MPARTLALLGSARGRSGASLRRAIIVSTGLLCAGLTVPLPAAARDAKLMFSIEEAMSAPAAKEKLSTSIRFFFGDQPHPVVKERLGQDVANRKTNALNKTDKTACEWVFLTALLSLQERARQLGADAVVNIESYYKKVAVRNATRYECHAGTAVAGVALRGEFVTFVK